MEEISFLGAFLKNHPIKKRSKYVGQNFFFPTLQTLKSCYIENHKRYKEMLNTHFVDNLLYYI